MPQVKVCLEKFSKSTLGYTIRECSLDITVQLPEKTAKTQMSGDPGYRMFREYTTLAPGKTKIAIGVIWPWRRLFKLSLPSS